MAIKIDEMLHGGRRRLRTCPDKILLDAGGFRLWADYLDVAPGFSGRFDFIHKINIPALFYIEWRQDTEKEGGEALKQKQETEFARTMEHAKVSVQWEPSNVCVRFEMETVRLTEHKFITEKDAAVSCMEWENCGKTPLYVRFVSGTKDGSFATTYGKRLSVAYFCNGQAVKDGTVWTAFPGETLELCVAAQLTLENEKETMREGCAQIRTHFRTPETALRAQKEEYQAWFDYVPELCSSSPMLDKTWAYRWYIYRRNLMCPKLGNLREPFFCEGRSHKMSKTPFQPEGWEFTKLIPLSVPMHLLDIRWYGKKEYGSSILHVMRDNQDETGEFRCAKVQEHGNPYANFFGWAIWQYYLVSRDSRLAQEALPVVKKQIKAWKQNYGNESDALLTQYIHQLTGMEYQPSYWYFHGFPDDCRDPEQFTPVKRVDRNVYHWLNTMAAAQLCAVCQDAQEEQYRRDAEEIRRDILEKMWDDETGYFYDLHYKTDEKAYVKNIVGVFPLFDGCAKEEHRRCLETLQSEEFDTPWPFPSVSTACPVYTAEGGWKGHFLKGRNGCIWNGPTWPFANSIVLDILGMQSIQSGHTLDDAFKKYFMRYTQMHYNGGDGEIPFLVEHYNSQTGECISDDVDYNHSYYINLVVKYLAGITADPEGITIDPLRVGLDHLSLTGLSVCGHRLDVKLENGGETLTVWMDGEPAARRTGNDPLRIMIPQEGRGMAGTVM